MKIAKWEERRMGELEAKVKPWVHGTIPPAIPHWFFHLLQGTQKDNGNQDLTSVAKQAYHWGDSLRRTGIFSPIHPAHLGIITPRTFVPQDIQWPVSLGFKAVVSSKAVNSKALTCSAPNCASVCSIYLLMSLFSASSAIVSILKSHTVSLSGL
jgi:hypothetical protein